MNRKERRSTRRTDKAAGVPPPRRASDARTDEVERLCNLARAQLAEGDAIAGLQTIWQALALRETPDAKAIFVGCFGRIRFAGDAPELRGLVARALLQAWAPIADFNAAACDLAKRGPSLAACLDRVRKAWPARLDSAALWTAAERAAICGDPLPLALLQSAPVADLELERFLTTVRGALLQEALALAPAPPIAPSVLAFYCTLARQCFINEYVFDAPEDEVAKARQLQASLATALQAQRNVPAIWPVALAAYVPLHSLAQAPTLLSRRWPAALADLLTQQIREPQEDTRGRGTIAALTPIDNAVSRAVRAQYEENPFPRWVKLPTDLQSFSLGEAMHILFPARVVQPSAAGEGCDILVAGCGTGHQAIETAQRYRGARVLAVDLSLASLAYAKRKTRELGLRNIEYAQADILQIGSIGRDFDMIEVGGVLHHLDDPFAGWRELVALLRPGGLMYVGLYSTVARAGLTAARTFIAERGYPATPDGIRRFRQEIVDNPIAPRVQNFMRSMDFFNISGCRDLFFHVQEHRLDLPQIKSFLDQHAFEFLGFVLEPQQLQKFQRRFPNDASAANLDLWHTFETEQPDFFASMYNFWIQKPRT